ncbi:hypothetical protein Fcan01_22236 [Folsomia candida]|uniref:Uncharacterized protein n=1 Tax=Folsomia candida TaxID=158441 RepID=A0A226DCW0_FOLCA|nr:hypothetical protein Fcan01_22236 [Folsomia candida]
MYRKDYMRLLKPYLSICQAFKCVPFDFDRKSGIVVKTGNASQIWSFRLQCILSVVYTVALVLQICVGRLSLTDSFMGAVFVLVHIIQTSTRWNYSLDKSQGQLINSLVRFEDQVLQDLPPARQSLGLRLMRIFLYIANISVIGIPILVSLLLTYVPTMPPFLLSMLPVAVEKCNLQHLVVRVCETWIQCHMMLSAALSVIYILFGGIVCILTYCRILDE